MDSYESVVNHKKLVAEYLSVIVKEIFNYKIFIRYL
jgi:hypothetical protein